MSEDRRKRIKEIIGSANKPKSEEEQGIKQNIKIVGNNNIAGTSITVIKTEEVVVKPKVKVTPGEGCITDKQAALIRNLVAEIVTLEKQLKQRPKHYAQVYGALFRHLSKNKRRPEITSYRLIPLDKFNEAETYLRSWIGRLSSLKTAPKKDSNWRKRKYAYIHTNIKQFSLETKLREYLQQKFGVTSLKDLSDEELQKTYQAVAYWKKQAQK